MGQGGFRAAVQFLWLLYFGTAVVGAGAQDADSSLDYLLKKVPGPVPEVFAPNVISGAGHRLHGAIALAPGGREVLWSVLPPAIMTASVEDGVWSEGHPVEVQGRGVQAPSFSVGGQRMYFQAVMEGGEGGLDLWWVQRTDGGWGEPRNLGPPVNTSGLESQPSLSAGGTLYFTGELEGAGLDRGIYRSEWIGGEYAAPELLGGGINSEYIDYCPWVAPDESYLLFASSRPRSEERLHIHVSFHLGDGSWSEPLNVHSAIGFEGEARFPSVSPDGRFLFFISGDSAYWVDIRPVLALAPEPGG